MPHCRRRFLTATLALSLLGAACSGDAAPVQESATSSATTTAAPATPDPAATPSPEATAADPVTSPQRLAAAMAVYLSAAMTGTGFDPALLAAAVSHYAGDGAAVDIRALDQCLQKTHGDVRAAVTDVYELTYDNFKAHEVEPGLWIVVHRTVEVVPEVIDTTFPSALVVTPSGVIGVLDHGDPAVGCWETATTRDTATDDIFARAMAADSPNLSYAREGEQGHGDAVAAPVPDPISDSNSDGSDDPDSGEEEWKRREAFPADPNDPEPIRSTGSNTWDIITVDDPGTFECVAYLGQGPEEILDATKSSYEAVPDAYLFVARFSDGTSIDIRIHPEVGSETDARAEVDRYTVPLGQLPTLLRQDIGRFAVRLGDETATASPGEGISMQVGNATTREADHRLEETLFHEAVHTSLDAKYGYMRSAEWLAAQEADGRFLTEYGRNNPDNEDLAESALYAYAVLHHPGRLHPADETVVNARIPNRIAFIAELLPPGEPIFAPTGTSQSCD